MSDEQPSDPELDDAAADPPPRAAAKNTGGKTGGGTLQLERRAQWVIDRWDERPSLRYSQMVKEVRDHFECGKTAAEQAIKRAYALLKAESENTSLTDRITAKYLSLVEGAERNKDWRAARSILDSLRRHLGLGAPERVEHTFGPSIEDLEELDDSEIAVLAKVDRVKAAPKVH